METVAHPTSERSPATSGGGQTTAAPPAATSPSTRRADPSNVMRGPLGRRAARSRPPPRQ
eukprot:14522540-Alexandrium_andersonii.AAC.1